MIPSASQSEEFAWSQPAPLPQPVAISRHDQHSLELKIGLNCPSERQTVAVDLFLFLPKSLHAREWSRGELRQDFHSRLRLALQQTVSRQENAVKLLHEHVEDLTRQFDRDESSTTLEKLFQETRRLGAVIGELLKFEARRLRTELLVVTSMATRPVRGDQVLVHIHEILARLDQAVQRTIQLSDHPRSHEIPVLRLLSEYVHHLYIDFLMNLGREHQTMRTPEGDLHSPWENLGVRIAELRTREARAAQGAAGSEFASEVTHELRLLRLSQIKKFFQSQMFIEVVRKETIRRFSEPAAAGAAAFAAMWAAAFEYLSQPQMRSVGFQGLVVICSGVALYVLKDRLKDKFRAVFTRQLESFLPDADQSLQADGKVIGKVREWFRVQGPESIPQEVWHARRKGDLTLAESHLPEDVIRYGQEFDLEPAVNSYGEFERSIQQVLRINVERFLKHLDDPYKTVGVVGEDGDLQLIKGRRIYHFHAAVMVSQKALNLSSWWRWPRSSTPVPTQRLIECLYRIVVDKNGIERVDPIC